MWNKGMYPLMKKSQVSFCLPCIRVAYIDLFNSRGRSIVMPAPMTIPCLSKKSPSQDMALSS